MRQVNISELKTSTLAKGRIGVYTPWHPKANNRGYVLRYRIVIEQQLNRYLNSNEHIHHKDKDKLNDSYENLEILSAREHEEKHKNLSTRKLDYNNISSLRKEGLGYKRIAKRLNYPVSSVKSACRLIERG